METVFANQIIDDLIFEYATNLKYDLIHGLLTLETLETLEDLPEIESSNSISQGTASGKTSIVLI
jgi:hypothetical protein